MPQSDRIPQWNDGRPPVWMTKEIVTASDTLGNETRALQGLDELFSRWTREGAHAAMVTR